MFGFELWTVYAIITAISILIEIMFPTMFCINFALAGLITSVVSLFWGSFYQTLVLFLVLSALFIIFVKPLLIKLLKKDTHTDFNSQYLGKIVPAIEPINTKSGAVSIYEERWEARVKEGCDEIAQGSDVRIIGNDSLVLLVEKI